jgi:OOP family OmpA-OmpF porin
MRRNTTVHVVGVAVSLALVGLLGAEASAQQDEEGCKDHPMFTRMRDYYISGCSTKPFDRVEFTVGDDKTTYIEGKATVINYSSQREEGYASEVQIARNYTNAVRTLGGTTVYDWGTGATLKISRGGREVWVAVAPANSGSVYDLTIVERGEMAQEVAASDMLAALQKDGFLALYINFDTGKATIRPESRPIVDQITSLMKQNPTLKISIEGHTDNVGTPAANKVLSEQRARAVLDAVVASGVPAARLSSVGWGQEKPIADNRSEDGRAKNRRVEIVKK